MADYWQAVVRMNEYQQERFVQTIIREMFHTVVGKRIALLGFAFKANTGDTRESPGIHVARKLLEEQAGPGHHRSPGPGQRPPRPGRHRRHGGV